MKIVFGSLALVLVVVFISIVTVWQTGTQKTSVGDGYSVGQAMLTRDEVASSDMDFSYGVTGSAPKVANSIAMESGSGEVAKNTDRMIIKTGSLSMVVKDVNNAVAEVVKYATDNGGFVVYTNIYKNGITPAGEVTVRIPAKVFDVGVGEIKKIGEVKSESVNGQDVTEEYVDLEAQLKNLRASENQFLQIMNRAVKIEDVLAVQRELTNVRGQIESIQGRMKYLSQSAELSTLTVYLSTDPNVLPTLDEQDKWKPWAQVKNAARSLVEVAKGLANFIIWIVVYLPVWLVIFGLVWLGRRWWKNKKIK